MEAAYKKATEEYMALHPEAKDVELKYDPKKLLESLGNGKKKPVTNQAQQIANLLNQQRNLNSVNYITSLIKFIFKKRYLKINGIPIFAHRDLLTLLLTKKGQTLIFLSQSIALVSIFTDVAGFQSEKMHKRGTKSSG
jgi:hypothetical protein